MISKTQVFDVVVLSISPSGSHRQGRTSHSQRTWTCELSNMWELVMQNEIKPVHVNNTQDLVELSKGRKTIPNRWVYKVKTFDCQPKYKAQLVVKGCTQTERVNPKKIL